MPVHTLYIGGGTPSVLEIAQLEKIVGAIDEKLRENGCGRVSDLGEFTIEVNPDDVVRGGEAYARALRRLCVNRVSMGVQSFDDGILHKMGRRHNCAQALEAWEILRSAGFTNISIDLIFGFAPTLDVEQIRERLLQMGLPEHISCYALSVEEGSGLDKMLQRGLYSLPSSEQCREQYSQLCTLLGSLGYGHYEISNWALPNFRSRHNSSYWDHTPYTGFGPGAHSFHINDRGEYCRRWNNPDLKAYIEAVQKGAWDLARGGEILDAEQIHEEELFLGLRTCEGVAKEILRGKTSPKLVPAGKEGNLRIPEDEWFISDAIILNLL